MKTWSQQRWPIWFQQGRLGVPTIDNGELMVWWTGGTVKRNEASRTCGARGDDDVVLTILKITMHHTYCAMSAEARGWRQRTTVKMSAEAREWRPSLVVTRTTRVLGHHPVVFIASPFATPMCVTPSFMDTWTSSKSSFGLEGRVEYYHNPSRRSFSPDAYLLMRVWKLDCLA